MSTSRSKRKQEKQGGTTGALPEAGPGEAPAWEEIENGRYRPRRIRGSYRGRELG